MQNEEGASAYVGGSLLGSQLVSPQPPRLQSLLKLNLTANVAGVLWSPIHAPCLAGWLAERFPALCLTLKCAREATDKSFQVLPRPPLPGGRVQPLFLYLWGSAPGCSLGPGAHLSKSPCGLAVSL